MFCLVLSRLLYVQVIWGEELQTKAIDQWTREIPIISSRGKIVDTNGVVIADNDDTYTVFVRKNAVKNMQNLAKTLSECLEIQEDVVYSRLKNTISSEITIKKQVEKFSKNTCFFFIFLLL